MLDEVAHRIPREALGHRGSWPQPDPRWWPDAHALHEGPTANGPHGPRLPGWEGSLEGAGALRRPTLEGSGLAGLLHTWIDDGPQVDADARARRATFARPHPDRVCTRVRGPHDRLDPLALAHAGVLQPEPDDDPIVAADRVRTARRLERDEVALSMGTGDRRPRERFLRPEWVAWTEVGSRSRRRNSRRAGRCPHV